MPDYAKGKIYKIEPLNGEEGDTYIGSTTKNRLAERMAKHRSSYREWIKGGRNTISSFNLFDKYGVEHCIITLIEAYPCQTKDELYARESHYIKSLNCVNKNVSFRTTEEKKQNQKEYRDSHKEDTKVYNDIYKKNNKETLKENAKYYYLRNKDDLLQKFECNCGGSYLKCTEKRHLKSIKHQNYLENLENSINV
jgi:hypothetical protein